MYLTPVDLADRYRVPLQTIYQWRTNGYGPQGIRVGRHIRYLLAECERWEHAQRPTQAAS